MVDHGAKPEPGKPPLLLQALLAITSIGWVAYGLNHGGVSAIELLLPGINVLALFAMWIRDSWRGMVIGILLLNSVQAMLDFNLSHWGQALWSAYLVVWPLIYIPVLIRDGRLDRSRQ